MKSILKMPLALCLILSIFGCQSPHPKSQPIAKFKNPVKARAKIQLKDLKKGDVHYLDLDILAQNGSRLRMDLRATLGILVASIAIQGQEISYLIPSRKKMFSGPVSEKSFKPLGSLQLHPFVFYSLIFDEAVGYGDWKCKVDPVSGPSRCDSKSLASSVEWLGRSGGSPRILIANQNFEMTWILKSIEEDIALKSEDFTLKMPPEYTAVAIP